MVRRRKTKKNRRKNKIGGLGIPSGLHLPNINPKHLAEGALGAAAVYGASKTKTGKKLGSMAKGALGKVTSSTLGKAGMGLGALGGAAALAHHSGFISSKTLGGLSKFGGSAFAPLFMMGNMAKGGAGTVLKGLKYTVASGASGVRMLTHLIGMPIKGVIGALSHMPHLMMGIGGVGSVAWLVSKGYLSWIYTVWRKLANAWASAPLFTWSEIGPDGKKKCPNVLRLIKWGGGPGLLVTPAGKEVGGIGNWKSKLAGLAGATGAAAIGKNMFGSHAGSGCFFNKQCPSETPKCVKSGKFGVRGKCLSEADAAQADLTQAGKWNPLTSSEGSGCFFNKQCPTGLRCIKSTGIGARGKCMTDASAALIDSTKKFNPFKSDEGGGCSFNKQCPSSAPRCVKTGKFAIRGKCMSDEDADSANTSQSGKFNVLSSKEGAGCFLNTQCPHGMHCIKSSKFSVRGKCQSPDGGDNASDELPPSQPPPSSEGKTCIFNKQCSSGQICKKSSKWSPSGKCVSKSKSSGSGGGKSPFLSGFKKVADVLLQVNTTSSGLQWDYTIFTPKKRKSRKKSHKSRKKTRKR